MRQHIATCAMHVLSPHLRICGDFRNGVIHLAHKIRGRLFAVLEVPIDSETRILPQLRGGTRLQLREPLIRAMARCLTSAHGIVVNASRSQLIDTAGDFLLPFQFSTFVHRGIFEAGQQRTCQGRTGFGRQRQALALEDR